MQTVIAALQAERIPCQHPGLNHAGLLPGLSYIEVTLRVPQGRRDEALALIAELSGGEAQKPNGATFRVRHSSAFLYATLGCALAVVANIVVGLFDYSFWPVTRFLMFVAGMGGGIIVGNILRTDYCSRPDYGGRLTIRDERCPKCDTPVRGELAKASEHFAAVEAWEQTQTAAIRPR